jgi:hypothetical protein
MSGIINQNNFPPERGSDNKFEEISTQELILKIKLLRDTESNTHKHPKPETQQKIRKISKELIDELLNRGIYKY